ncbi:uncharacterized protein H6S33_004543 [Morchella sextelata]|uniref:uncharacterized protein n=1 Tax=Morchella sextelata TaxID=1174677 RepID=UPI001D037254|nr:uncharacterized protein H6S33_004543 [Morchella sextelata]KAH0605321.1 hypothetical protein H6S33_004543 [Morchella sextelata]
MVLIIEHRSDGVSARARYGNETAALISRPVQGSNSRPASTTTLGASMESGEEEDEEQEEEYGEYENEEEQTDEGEMKALRLFLVSTV